MCEQKNQSISEFFDEIDNLLDLSAAAERAKLPVECFYPAMQTNIRHIETCLDKQLKILAVFAIQQADRHYSYRKQEQLSGNCPARYATRARLSGKSLSCTWYYNGFIGGREEGPYFKSLPKDRGRRYRERVFREAHLEERQLIDNIEQHYSHVCEAVELLKKQYRCLVQLDNLLQKSFINYDPIADVKPD